MFLLNNIQKQTAADGKPPYAAVCRFRRQGSFFYSENHLESGGNRGNMLTRQFAFVPTYIGRMAKNFSHFGDILRLICSRFVQFMGVLCNGV